MDFSLVVMLIIAGLIGALMIYTYQESKAHELCGVRQRLTDLERRVSRLDFDKKI
jgi:hypothetical protein